jgi:LIM homeobox transcription factor 1
MRESARAFKHLISNIFVFTNAYPNDFQRVASRHVSFLPDAYPGHSGESFCSSDLSLDGTDGGFDIGENDGSGADGSHQGASHSHHGSSSHDTPSLSQSLHAAIHNPIDKLFMMQSSYFSGDHA